MNHMQMNFEQFEASVRTFFEERYKENATIDIRSVLKNNGVQLRGLSIFRKDEKVTPTIYLEDFYSIYRNGIPIEEVLEKMEAIYAERKQSENLEIKYFYQFDSVKDTLRIKMINYEKNQQFLEKIPYIRFLDLAVICYSLFESVTIPNGAITIHQEHLKLWEITQEELFTQAVFNSQQYDSEVILKMAELMQEMHFEMPQELEKEFRKAEEAIGMCVLTNAHKLNGAGVIFYPKVLEKCAELFRSDFYVLPSSIHEVILIPEQDERTCNLLSMVRDVNDEQVAQEEILSYHVYKYSKEQGILEDIVTKESIVVKE